MSDDKLLKILSIDAWRDGDGGWTWNNHYKVGEISLEDFDKLTTNRRLLGYMRKHDYLSGRSQGLVRVDNPGCYDGVFIELQDRRTGEPLFAISSIH